MHIVIIGAGRVGVTVAEWLVSAGHETAVVEWDRSRCSALDEALGAVSVLGDGTDAGVLAKAGANRADAFMATTRRDDFNLVACQLAKHQFNVPRTMSVVNSGELTGLFGALGIDVPIDVPDLVLGRIQEGLTSHGLVRLMPVSDQDGRTLVAIKIPSDSSRDRRAIKDISLPDGTVISLVISRDGVASVPGEGTLIQPGDEVVAVTSADEEARLRDLLIEGPGE